MFDISPYIPGIIAAYSILFFAASSPGPSVALLVGIATEQGRTPALIATLGVALGSVTINILTMLGVGLILSQAAWAMALLRIIGAAYLLYLAYGAFRKVIHPPTMSLTDSNYRTPLRIFLVGYLLQVTNPKSIAFWLAISSIGAVEGASFAVVLLFVMGSFLISFTCHGAWSVALSVKSVRLAYFHKRRWIEMVLGGFFTFTAFKLATSDV